jgi:hypothetical protein
MSAREHLGEVRCPSGEIAFGAPGERGVVVGGLPRTLALDVWGVRMPPGDHERLWKWVYVDVLPGSRSVVWESVARVALGERLCVRDAAGGGVSCELETTWLPGQFEVLRDLDDQGRLSRVRIDLGSDAAVARLRECENDMAEG